MIIIFFIADEEPEKKELLGVNTGIITKSPKLNPFVKIFSFFYKNYLYFKFEVSLLNRSFKFCKFMIYEFKKENDDRIDD